jgi:hypothetical protein
MEIRGRLKRYRGINNSNQINHPRKAYKRIVIRIKIKFYNIYSSNCKKVELK